MTDHPAPAESEDKLASDDRTRARFGFRFEAGDVLFREGDLGTQAYLLEEGRVRLRRLSPSLVGRARASWR